MTNRYSFLLLILLTACTTDKRSKTIINLVEGKTIYENTCKSCHGSVGEGNVKFMAPPLANLEEWYLFRQVINFRNSLRGYDSKDTLGLQMSAMVRTLKDTMAVRNVVAYIQSIPDQNGKENLLGNWKNGENIYQSVCGSCHGPEGKGNRKLDAPPLNVLDSWYLKNQFEKFKKGMRGGHKDDKLGAQMVAMATLLKEDQSLTDVITYLRSEIPSASK